MKVLEKLKNKKILMMYLIGVLVLSFGVAFAYFNATSSVTGEGVIGTNVTTTIEADGVVADGNIGFNNVDIYPGHTTVASIKVTGKGDNKPLMFDIIFNGSNTFHTPLNYTVYKSDRNIDASYTCEKKTGNENSGKTYYEECTGNNVEELGSSITNGTINKGEGIQELVNDELIVTSPNGTEIYYYIVIEYPNLDNSQNEDMGASISGKITIQEGNKYQAPELFITENLTSGNNGWYISVNLNTSITTQTGNYQAEYCITSEDSCIPDQTASITDNSFDVTLDSNSAPQKLCVRVTDEYNQIGEGCSNSYNVDSTNPTVNITSSEVTENSITITVSGSDAHSGISGYRFSSDNGNSYTDITTSDSSYTYTFNNLESGTSYNIVIQVVDKAGNIESVSQIIETDAGFVRDTLLANYPTILTRDDFSTTVTNTTTGTIYYEDTSKGRTYYFAGNPTDNWVRFGGFYWRIIRINEDGTIRMIYQGTSANTVGSNTQIGQLVFNSVSTDNAYVGYMYQNNQLHGLQESSTIKGALDQWYQNNLTGVSDKIDESAGFCGDRTPTSGTGIGTTLTYYGGYTRLYGSRIPTFECSSNNDLYTTSGSSQGNKALTYPIGLISADEVVYAGGSLYSSNNSYYLYTGQTYWTISPSHFDNGWAYVFQVDPNGSLYGISYVFNNFGIRPVINLKADVKITGGNGTSTNPYIVN